MPIVVDVADACALSQAVTNQARLADNVSKDAVPIVTKEMVRRLLSGRKSFQARTIHQKNVRPAVSVIVKERRSRTRGLQYVFLACFSPEIIPGPEPCFCCYIDKAVRQARSTSLRKNGT